MMCVIHTPGAAGAQNLIRPADELNTSDTLSLPAFEAMGVAHESERWGRRDELVEVSEPFFPLGQRKRGSKDDRIRERVWSEINKEKDHETFPKLSQRDQAVVSTRGA